LKLLFYILYNYEFVMSSEYREVIVKITSTGTISLPKQFRRHMDVQKGDYVKVVLNGDGVILRKATIS